MKKFTATGSYEANRSARFLYFSLILFTCILPSRKLQAQPYLDIVSVKYTNSPGSVLVGQNKNAVKLEYYNLSTNLPLQFKNKKGAVILSPFLEKWKSHRKDTKTETCYSLAFPVSLLKELNKSWDILATGILRMNNERISTNAKMQVGGAFITTYKRSSRLKYKFGVYANNDLFGIFIVPLLGVDWQINERNNLFGILPGSLTYEHKINKRFYYGANFKAITNSYGTTAGYWRIDENQLGIYLDTYIKKSFVINLEAGHSIGRKIRTGVKKVSRSDQRVADNCYLKLMLAYRIRFEKR